MRDEKKEDPMSRRGARKPAIDAGSPIPDDPERQDDAPARESGNRGDESLQSYFREVKQSSRLLSKQEEADLGRAVQRRIAAAVELLRKEAAKPVKCLYGRPKAAPRGVAYSCLCPNHRFRRGLEIDGLSGKTLVKRLRDFVVKNPIANLQAITGKPSTREIVLLIECNCRLVISIAKPYARTTGVPLADLIQDGNAGLIIAAGRFDPDFGPGYRFSTYATWWINHAIRRALTDKSKLIRIPVHAADFAVGVRRIERRLAAIHGRRPTDDEIAADIIQSRRDVPGKGGVTRDRKLGEKVAEARMHAEMASPLSLDMPVFDENAATLGELLAAQKRPDEDPVHRIDREEKIEALRSALAALDARTRDIVMQRFDDEKTTLKEVGDAYGLSRERARQIQNEGLKKLRRILQRKLA
jgi:RNA polymerase sigma factor (sigma-70 family)